MVMKSTNAYKRLHAFDGFVTISNSLVCLEVFWVHDLWQKTCSFPYSIHLTEKGILFSYRASIIWLYSLKQHGPYPSWVASFVSIVAKAVNCYCVWCLQNIPLFFSLVTCLWNSGVEGSYSTFLLWQPNQKPFSSFLHDNEQHCSGNNIDRLYFDFVYLMHWERNCLSHSFPKQLSGLLC